jgi:hypothetical protein
MMSVKFMVGLLFSILILIVSMETLAYCQSQEVLIIRNAGVDLQKNYKHFSRKSFSKKIADFN